MPYFFSILFLLLSWRFSPLEPITELEPPHGLFADFGFKQNDSEKFVLILNLVRTGAYKIEEEDIGYYKGESHSWNTYFEIFSSNDSVSIEEYRLQKNKPSYLYQKQIYLTNGKLIYSLEKWPDGRINYLNYFKTKDSLLKYNQAWWNRDSLYLAEVLIYDDIGRLIESDEVGIRDIVIRKTFYQYDNEGRKIEERQYFERINQPSAPMNENYQNDSIATKDWLKIELKRQDSSSRVPIKFELSHRETNKIDTFARIIETSYYFSTRNDSLPAYHYFTQYDNKWRETITYELLDRRKKISTQIKYKDDDHGHLISMTTIDLNNVVASNNWSYDNQGRCIAHTEDNQLPGNDHRTTWSYDSKGNIIESDEFWGGEPSYKHCFKIYYK